MRRRRRDVELDGTLLRLRLMNAGSLRLAPRGAAVVDDVRLLALLVVPVVDEREKLKVGSELAPELAAAGAATLGTTASMTSGSCFDRKQAITRRMSLYVTPACGYLMHLYKRGMMRPRHTRGCIGGEWCTHLASMSVFIGFRRMSHTCSPVSLLCRSAHSLTAAALAVVSPRRPNTAAVTRRLQEV